MKFKDIKEKINFLNKQEKLTESLLENPTKFNFEKLSFKYLAPASGSVILLNFFISNTFISFMFGLLFFTIGMILEAKKTKDENLKILMSSFPIENVSSIKEYQEKLSMIIFDAVVEENKQVSTDLLRALSETKKPEPLKIIEKEE